MSLLGDVELKIVELPDALEFTVTREDGLLENVAVPAIAMIVFWMFWRAGALWPRFIAGFAAISTLLAYIANWIQCGETRLRVTREGLFAEGNLGQLFSRSITVAIEDVSSIGFYDGGGDGGISGLYARHGWRFWPLLPRLSQEQTETLVDAIQKKFPEIPAESELNSSLFGDGGKLINLGLSKSSTETKNGQQ
jgi:hypothetical protein